MNKQKYSLHKHSFLWVLVSLTLLSLAAIGCSSSGDSEGDGDGGGGGIAGSGTPETFTADGTYSYNPNTGKLTVNIVFSDFSDPEECGIEVGTHTFNVGSVSATRMFWDEDDDDDDAEWARDGGTAGNIVGTWDLGEEGNYYELSLNSDGTLDLLAEIVFCGDGSTGGSGSGDDSSGSDGGAGSSTPETSTAGGTYSYNSNTGELSIDVTSSDFSDPEDCGIAVGTHSFNVDSLSAAEMLWDQNSDDETEWSRIGGTADDLVGSWANYDEGNVYELSFNANGTWSLTADIFFCEDSDTGSDSTDDNSGSDDSGDSGGSGSACSAPTVDATDDWLITETSTTNDCGEGVDAPYTLEVTQFGSSVLVFSPDLGQIFAGQVCGNTIEWTGSYPEDGGITVLNPMTATVSGGTLNGTSNWTWSDGINSCSGTTTITGSN